MEEDKKNLNTEDLSHLKQSGINWKPGMEIFAQVSVWIVAPIVLALVFGKMLDAHYGTKPIIFLVLAGIGFLFTCFGIVQVVKSYIKKINPDVKSGPRPESVGEDKYK